MGRLLRRLIGGTVVVGGIGAIGGGMVYQRRLKENKSVTAEDYNAAQNQELLELTYKNLNNCKDCPKIQLYRYTTCPFCGKAKAFLDYFNVPHECVEVEPMFKGEIADSKYKKVPQLKILGTKPGEEAYLVDSDLIVETLAKHVGVENQLSDADIQKWRGWARDQLVRFLVVNINTSLTEAWKGYNYIDEFDTIPTWNKWFLKIMGAPVMYIVAMKKTIPTLEKNGHLKKGDDARQRLFEEVNKFHNEALEGGKREFHGGAKPDLADLDVYGVFQSIRGHRVYDDLTKNTEIDAWMKRMDTLTRAHEKKTPVY